MSLQSAHAAVNIVRMKYFRLSVDNKGMQCNKKALKFVTLCNAVI